MISRRTNSQMRCEGRLLLRMCSGATDVGQSEIEVDWNRLVDLGRRHRVMPTMYRRLRETGLPVPSQVSDELKLSAQSNAARVLQLAGEMRRVLGEFENANIQVIAFKGIVLAQMVYGDLSCREVGDLDLLVHREDIIRAADLLITLGHRPFFPTSTATETAYLAGLSGARREEYLFRHCEHHLVYAPTSLNVDLHWAMSLREFGIRLDLGRLWSRAQSATVAGCRCLTLCPEDLLVVLCLNGAKDGWPRLDRICDVAELLRRSDQLNWDQVFDYASTSGCGRMVRVGLLLADTLLNAPVPAGLKREIQSDNQLTRLVERIVQRLLGSDGVTELSPAARFLFDLNMRDGLADRIRYCLGQFRPGVGDWAALPLPRGLGFIHYLVRPLRLAVRHIMRGDPTEKLNRTTVGDCRRRTSPV